MWNFSFIKRKQKTKSKIDRLSVALSFLFAFSLLMYVCDNSCYCLNSFFCWYCFCGLLLFFSSPLTRDRAYGVQMTRWYSNAVAHLPMHILNSEQNTTRTNIFFSFLFPHSPRHFVFYLTWGHGEGNGKKKIVNGTKMTVTTTVTIQSCTYAKTAIKCCDSQNQNRFQNWTNHGNFLNIRQKKKCSTNGFECFVAEENEKKNTQETCEIKWTKGNLKRKKKTKTVVHKGRKSRL